MNFFIMVSLILSVLLGIFRGIDLTFWTDAETGLCIVGPVWLRYGALAVAVGIAVAAGRCRQPPARGPAGAAAVSRRPARCGDTARLPASWHWRRLSAMERLLCCASSGWGAAWQCLSGPRWRRCARSG